MGDIDIVKTIAENKLIYKQNNIVSVYFYRTDIVSRQRGALCLRTIFSVYYNSKLNIY
jgi:energy-converting hydrogenase A subunit M